MEQVVLTAIKFSFVPILIVALYTAIVYTRLVKELKLFAWFIFLSGFIQLTSAVLWFLSRNNMPLLHLYVAAGFVCLALFYQKVLNGFIDQKIIQTILISFLVFTIINSLFVQKIFAFNSYALTVESVLIIILSISTYMLMMEDIVKRKRQGLIKSLNWINSGLFIYYTSSLLIFYFGDLITLFFPSPLVNYAWVLHAVFSNIMYACFFIALWHRPPAW